jgi:hypothetical protein
MHEVEVPVEEMGIMGWLGLALHGREHVEADRWHGGVRATDDGGKCDVLLADGVDERDGDGVPMLREGAREVHHRDKVARHEGRVQDDGLLRHGWLVE